MSAVIPPRREDRADPAEPIRDAVRGVPLVPADEHLFDVIAWSGEQTVREFVSLLHRAVIAYATRPALAEPRAVRAVYDTAPPAGSEAGVDEKAAEGLPSWMSVGAAVSDRSYEGAWWHCRLHRFTLRGLAGVEEATCEAWEHLRKHHGQGGSGE